MNSQRMEIGRLEGQVLVFGGPYGNLPATRAMRGVAEGLGVAAGNVLCTGDTVAYCAEPEQTVAELRDWGCHVVMGNVEEALATQAPDCGCGFDEGSACSALSAEWYRFAVAALSPASIEWMGRLPRQIRFDCGGLRFLAVHGSVAQINEFVFESDPVERKQQQLARADADVVIGGHCGIPFGQRLPGGHWLNAGVIGMPANDGTPDGWYLLLTPTGTGVEASWHRLPYPYPSARDAMARAGLAPAYAECLQTGLWPSLDVLPEAERRASGHALQPETRILAPPAA
jgi:predicted phosphodiesterase